VSTAAGKQAALGCAVEEVEARLNDKVKTWKNCFGQGFC
jgi:hypothetical protein